MAHLASTYRYQRKWNEAEQLEVQVMDMSKKLLGPEHPHTLSSMRNIAGTYKYQGKWNEAEQLEVQVMNIRNEIKREQEYFSYQKIKFKT